MAIRVTCPSCSKTLQAPDGAAGKKVRCPSCKAVMTVPSAATSASSEPEPLLDPEPMAPEPSPLADALAAQDKKADDDDGGGAYGLAAPPAESTSTSDERRRPCPMCGEMIPTTAMKCRFCGEVFDKTLKSVGRSGGSGGGPVPTYLGWAIAVTLLCCVPGGIVAIVYASQVNSKLASGDQQGALTASKNAKTWCLISAGVGFVFTALMCGVNILGAVASNNNP